MMLSLFRRRQGYLLLSESSTALSLGWARLEAFCSSTKRTTTCILIIIPLIFLAYLAGRNGGVHRCQQSPQHLCQQSSQQPLESYGRHNANIGSLVIPPKPRGIRVVGLVFYGRQKFVEILDCYLRKNLIHQGGYLDTVQFLVHTDDQGDLNYLDDLVESVPGYEKMETAGPNSWAHYESMWSQINDLNTVYVKIDDDIVYIHNEAIPRLVNTLLDRPEAVAVGTNTINHAMLAAIHWRTGAIHPFIPEDGNNLNKKTTDWRVSNLPPFTGNLSKVAEIPFNKYPLQSNQRFLSLPDNINNLLATPYAKVKFDDFWEPWQNWIIAGQSHYSLFQNIEKEELQRYAFGVWNTYYNRHSINFIAIRGSTLADRPIADEDDEQEITVTIPRELNRPFLVEGSAIVSHFAYHGQGSLMLTDILDRYTLLANEKACTKD